jgi:hypothetical protein
MIAYIYMENMVIYAIPGLGTTGKLFERLKVKGCEVKVLDWPQPQAAMNLQDYAKLFLNGIDASKPFCLLGVSFGGMLCSELSHMVSAQKVFLISSCKNKFELPWTIRFQRFLPIYKLFSEKMLVSSAFRFHWMLGFKKDYKDIFREMIHAMPKDYIKCSAHMIVNWENEKMPRNSIHIHGDKDRLLYYKCVKADHTIKNGSHAMIVYNAEEINELLSRLNSGL